MNNQTADRESGSGNVFYGDRRVVLEELDDEFEGDGEREFVGDEERRAALSDGSVVRPGTLPPTTGMAPGSNVPVTQVAPVINGDLSSTVNSAQPNTNTESSRNSEAKSTVARTVAAVVGRNNERSVRIAEDVKLATDVRGRAGVREGD